MSKKIRGRRPIQEITAPQRRTLQEIRLYTNQRGFPPTIKELADILGISHASARGQVNQSVRKRFLAARSRLRRVEAVISERKGKGRILN
ncbi:MAG: LexA family transcriptional regulator [candidate division Zixibacteria bacterium]|nr:LexA family transcriptional regulator [candidate division Zixibacteria bacterium]